MLVSKNNHQVSIDIFDKLSNDLSTFSGGTKFTLGDITLDIEGKDGLGGLIEEWFGAWCQKNEFSVYNPKTQEGTSQMSINIQ